MKARDLAPIEPAVGPSTAGQALAEVDERFLDLLDAIAEEGLARCERTGEICGTDRRWWRVLIPCRCAECRAFRGTSRSSAGGSA